MQLELPFTNEPIQPDFITLSGYAKDITGHRFGRLVALGPVGRNSASHIMWLCRCDCGNTSIVACGTLRQNHTRSCGCWQTERRQVMNTTHNMSHNPLYIKWKAIFQRCTKPHDKGYPYYGGRGITLCDEWMYDFQAFYDHVSQLPHCGEKGYSLDRIDNSLGYSPGNVRFATRTEQARNTRKNVMVSHNGETKCISEWASEAGMKANTLLGRLQDGWPMERALTETVHSR